MYDAITEPLLDGKATRYRVLFSGSPLAHAQALELLRNDAGFRTFMTGQLKQSAYTAFRWETPRIQTTTVLETLNSYCLTVPHLRTNFGMIVSDMRPNLVEYVLGMISDRPIWLSTAGGGVAWLHVRLDSTPKYYGYAPYRDSK